MNAKQNIKALLFDFAGVLGTDGHWLLMKDVLPNIEEKRAVIEELDDKVDRGDISAEEYSHSISRITGISADSLRSETMKRIVINSKLVAYIKELKAKYKIGLLSNFIYEWLGAIIEKEHLAQYFDSIYISSRYGMIKPEPGAFDKAIDLLGVNRNEVIFIDDRQIHVDAARALGIPSILYVTTDQCKTDLERLIG